MPKTLLWVLYLVVIFLLLFTLFRLVTFISFKPEGHALSDYLPSFLLGARYDLRWISFGLLPVVLASLRPGYSPYFSSRNRRFWTWYLALVTFFYIFFFAADFGCFSYNRTRLSASALNFAEDPGISLQMLWQSYPLTWMVLALVMVVLLLRFMFRRLHGRVESITDGKKIRHRRLPFVFAGLVLVMLAFGSLNPRPLMWNDAFVYNDSFRSYLALNPLQNFFTTLRFRKPDTDAKGAMENFPLMAGFLDLDGQQFSYLRKEDPVVVYNTPPNVILVMCESLSMYKSSMSGNPLNTTPYFNALADSGLLFTRCFTPHFSTARGLFATLTGIPDVQLSKFSTRNPQALDQHTIINEFRNYNKYYFLGGNPSFNNFEGLVKNIDGVQMVTEGSFGAQPVDVWGISDKDLFSEANQKLSKENKPFFAIIQTADNHRPFTIPAADSGFKKKMVPAEKLKQYGFESLEEYNAFRYFDFCIESFMEKAKKQSWYNNTIFVFIGDHGVSGNAKALYPAVYTEERLTEKHVPLLFYAPALVKPGKRDEVVSQVDVLPTIASLAHIPYRNTTLGRNLLGKPANRDYAFVISHDEGTIGMVANDFYFTSNLNFRKEELHFFSDSLQYTPAQKDSISRAMSRFTRAYYETARYMLVNNGKIKK